MTRRTLHSFIVAASLFTTGDRPRAGRGAARAGGAAGAASSGRRRAGDRARRRSRDRSRQRRHLGGQGRHHRPGGAGDHHHHHRRRDQGARLQVARSRRSAPSPAGTASTRSAIRSSCRRCAASARRSLLMRDGMSLFDPWGNIAWTGRTQPLETVKRIEVVTGPGGVLWGANSFLGIVNLITKDAEDVNGLELSAGYGDGPGNKQDFKAYALFGKTFLNGKLKIFQHISYETLHRRRSTTSRSSSPRRRRRSRRGIAYFAQNAPRDPRAQLDASSSTASTRSGRSASTTCCRSATIHPNLGFANAVVQTATPGTTTTATASSSTRTASPRIASGVTVKGYGIQFVRDLRHPALPGRARFLPQGERRSDIGGLHFSFAGPEDLPLRRHRRPRLQPAVQHPPARRRRVLLRRHARLERSASPSRPIPTSCRSSARSTPPARASPQLPARATAIDTGRYVAAGYVDAQWRPFQKLTLDGGVRYPEGLRRSAPTTSCRSARRPSSTTSCPTFTSSSTTRPASARRCSRTPRRRRAASATAPTRTCRTETSQSFQGELNARLLRNVRKVRELELRVDYSYTVLSNLIQIRDGGYGNTGKRAIHSVEGYAKLYLNGDHFLQASYTYLYSTTTDAGVVRAMPNHWVVARRLVQPRQEPARREHEPRRLRRLRGSRTASRPASAGSVGGTGTGFVGTTTARDQRPRLRPPDAGGQPAARLPPALLQATSCSSRGSSTTCSTSTTTTPTSSTT